MGMAASQSRFLHLTARKSNTEYQGQQINQQRTALANESSNLYQQLQNLEVPTPPNVKDFYQTVYSFTTDELDAKDDPITYTFTSISKDIQGNKIANLSYEAERLTKQASKVREQGSLIMDTSRYNPGQTPEGDNLPSEYNVEGGVYTGYMYTSQNNTKYAVYMEDATNEFVGVLDNKKYTGNNSNRFRQSDYVFTMGNYKNKLAYVMINNEKHYLSNKDLSGMSENVPKDTGVLCTATYVNNTRTEQAKIAGYNTNEEGRITSIRVETNDGTIKEFAVTVTTREDEAGYKAAMQDYTFLKDQYEKAQADINSKTEEIQEKDRTLEIKLKQLDTEQSAIATEMEAVQKVVDDNTESTFKTFG